MMSLWSSEDTSLARRARLLTDSFAKKKSEKMKEWLGELVKIVQREVLLEASMGKYKLDFSMDKFVYEVKQLSETIDGVTRWYDISSSDKTVLLSELKSVYSDKSKYEDLKVEINSQGTSLLLSW